MTSGEERHDLLLLRILELHGLIEFWLGDGRKRERAKLDRAIQSAMTEVFDAPDSGEARRHGRALDRTLARCEAAFLALEESFDTSVLAEAFRRIAELRRAALQLADGQPIEELRRPSAPEEPWPKWPS